MEGRGRCLEQKRRGGFAFRQLQHHALSLMPNLAHVRTVMSGGREQNVLFGIVCYCMFAKASVQQVLGGTVGICLCLYASSSKEKAS